MKIAKGKTKEVGKPRHNKNVMRPLRHLHVKGYKTSNEQQQKKRKHDRVVLLFCILFLPPSSL